MSRFLVVGGSGDIGRSIVKQLLSAGHEVICHYFSNDISAEVEVDDPGRISFWQQDLSVQVNTLPDFIDGLDGIIYCAGQEHYNLFQDDTDVIWEVQYHIHVFNMMKIIRQCIPQLIGQSYGRIIVISSIWGEIGASMEVVYSTMKSAQLGFVKALAKELATTAVTVNAISPGFVRGRMNSGFSPEELHEILDEIPQGEYIEPEEIAALCQYLIQPQAKHITGQVLRINGGWLT